MANNNPENKSGAYDMILSALGIKSQPVELNLSKVLAIEVESPEATLIYVRSKENPEEWLCLSANVGSKMALGKDIAVDFKEILVKQGKLHFFF